MTATPRRIELRIRRLELPEWDAAVAGGVSRAALCTAVEAELSLLLGRSPAAPAPADSDVTLLARRIARAVHRELRVGEGAS
ncbi:MULTISPECIES: hypothetical protein [unclassified Streptomyces]|uniref:hypothetical protein n=1 Tax=unclassified Streptomyces TaxID=2593676 RepID=UPI0033287221